MFSKELQELDRNTVQLMIDEMQDDINRLSASNAEQRNTITEQSNMLTEKDNMLVEKDNTIAEQNNTIAELKARLVQFENPDDKK